MSNNKRSNNKTSISTNETFEEKAKSENVEKNLDNNTEPVLSIVYDYSKLEKKGYYYRYDGDDKIRGLGDVRTQVRQWIGIDGILRKMDISEKKFNRVKFCDPNLVEILYNEKGMEAVDTYLEQLEKGKYADKKQLPYRMTYNMNSIWKNKDLSFKTKRLLMKMAKENRYVADVQMNHKFTKRIASLFMAFGLALVAIPKMLPFQAGDGNKTTSSGNVMVDSIDRVDADAGKEHYSIQTSGNREDVTTKTNGENKWQYKSEKQAGTGKQKNKSFSEISDKVKASLDSVTREFESNNNSSQNELDLNNASSQNELDLNNASSQNELDANNKENQIKDTELHLGSTIKLAKGTQFMESVSGGKTGSIGDDASPEDGVYVIDHVAETSKDGISSRYGLEGNLSHKTTGTKQYVHVSYVAGAESLEEAQKIINEQKESAKKGVADTSKIQPRGWLSMDDAQQR